MPKANKGGWKTCSRGHKYRGPRPCPICYPGRNKPLVVVGDERDAFISFKRRQFV